MHAFIHHKTIAPISTHRSPAPCLRRISPSRVPSLHARVTPHKSARDSSPRQRAQCPLAGSTVSSRPCPVAIKSFSSRRPLPGCVARASNASTRAVDRVHGTLCRNLTRVLASSRIAGPTWTGEDTDFSIDRGAAFGSSKRREFSR